MTRTQSPQSRTEPRRSDWAKHARRFAPVAALLVVAAIAYAAGLPKALSPGVLAEREAQLRAAAAQAPLLAMVSFVVVYGVLTGACLPVALVLSLAAGVIFGVWIGAGLILLGATAGALLTYFAARSAFAPALIGRAERDARLQKIMQGFGRDAFAYILTLRLLPGFPFSVTNVAAGLAAAPVRPFVLASLAGGVPTSLIYAGLGEGLGASVGSQRALHEAMRSPGVLWPLVALAVLSVAPMVVQRLRRRAR